MRAAFAVALTLLGCGHATAPFYVERPLSRTAPSADDRRVPVATTAAPKAPKRTEAQLGNGMTAEVVERSDTGLVSLVFVNPRARLGTEYLPVFLGDALLAGVVSGDGGMIFPVTLDGRSPRIITGLSGTTVSLSCRAELFERALDLLSAVVRRPVFDARALEPIRARTSLDLLGIRGSYWAWQLAGEHRGEHFNFDEERIVENVRGLDQLALSQAHRRLFGPRDSGLVVVGDVAADVALRAIQQRFADWDEAPASPSPSASPSPKAATGRRKLSTAETGQVTAALPGGSERAGRKVLVVKESSYPYLSIIQDAPAADTPDALAFALLVDVLGAHNSRLMQALRYQSAHVYFIRTRQITVPERGRYLFLDTQAAEQTLTADLRELLRALGELRTASVTDRELSGAKARYGSGVAQALESGGGVAGYLASVRLHDALPIDDLAQRIAAITPEDLRRVAIRYFDPDHATIVVQGRVSSTVLSGLRALGEVAEL